MVTGYLYSKALLHLLTVETFLSHIGSKKGVKDQNLIQSSTTPVLGYHINNRQKHN